MELLKLWLQFYIFNDKAINLTTNILLETHKFMFLLQYCFWIESRELLFQKTYENNLWSSVQLMYTAIKCCWLRTFFKVAFNFLQSFTINTSKNFFLKLFCVISPKLFLWFRVDVSSSGHKDSSVMRWSTSVAETII